MKFSPGDKYEVNLVATSGYLLERRNKFFFLKLNCLIYCHIMTNTNTKIVSIHVLS